MIVKTILKVISICTSLLLGSLVGSTTIHTAFAGPTQCVMQSGVNLCRYSTREWTMYTFKGKGFSTAAAQLNKIATENIISEKCDGTWYRILDSGWIANYNAAYSDASTEAGFMSCQYEHFYISESWHNYYNPATSINQFEYSADGP